MHEVLGALGSARAVVFDVDGTLYAQSPVRRAMMVRLARAHVTRPVLAARTMRVLAAYRRAQETMRESGFEGDVAAEQLRRAATDAGVRAEDASVLVEQWIETEPLDLVAANPRLGLIEVLDVLAGRGVALGIVSDYPADRKLAALGIAERFDVVLSAQDPRVNAFKPNPKGLLVALGDLGIAPADALYVGDRAEVDAAAAAAARVRCVLVGRPPRRRQRDAAPSGAIPRIPDVMEEVM